MATTKEDRTPPKPIYPDMIIWWSGMEDENRQTTLNFLSWVRFWRDGKEYERPQRMSVDADYDEKYETVYEEEFHKYCHRSIRYTSPTGDFGEPIKYDDKHVITIEFKKNEEDDIREEGDS